MIFFINSETIDIAVIKCRDLNFGQKVYNRPVYNYIIKFSVSEFKEIAQPFFDEFVNESKKDDLQYGDDLDIVGLSQANYPNFNEAFINCKELLRKVVIDFIYDDIFNYLFNENVIEKCKYVINSVEDFIIDEENVKILGEAYAIGQPGRLAEVRNPTSTAGCI